MRVELLKAVCKVVDVPIIASGGAGSQQDFITLFDEIPEIDAGLAASVFHFGEIKIKYINFPPFIRNMSIYSKTKTVF